MQNKGLVLVTGAGGFVGEKLVRALLAEGYRVRATDLPTTNLSYAGDIGGELVYSDLLRPSMLEAAVAGVDYVIHCAALFDLTSKIETLCKVNVTGTENLLKALAGRAIKHFIHISSSDIYGTLKYLPGDENHPLKPTNPYAVSKKEGEELVWRYSKEYDIPVTVLRPSAIYGPGSTYIAGVFFFWPIFMRMLGITRYPYIAGGSKLTFAHIDDVIASSVFLLGREAAFGEAFNVADPECIDSAVFATKLYRTFGVKNLFSFVIPIPHVLVDIYGELMLYTSGPVLRILNWWVKKRWLKEQKKFGLNPRFVPHFERQFYCYFIGHRYFSSRKLIGLGYKFKNRSFDEGFPLTFQWYLDNKWLPPMNGLGM